MSFRGQWQSAQVGRSRPRQLGERTGLKRSVEIVRLALTAEEGVIGHSVTLLGTLYRLATHLGLEMRPQLSIERKLEVQCYFRLQDGETRSGIYADLVSKGFLSSQIDMALSQAEASLKEYARYKNIELVKSLGGAAIVFAVGAWLSQHSDAAPGRFQGLYFKVYLLSIAIAGYGIWARLQKV